MRPTQHRSLVGLGHNMRIFPTTPLAPIAFGESDMIPNYYRVANRSRVRFMYDSEIENPWYLLSGHFDLAFVIVYVHHKNFFPSDHHLRSMWDTLAGFVVTCLKA